MLIIILGVAFFYFRTNYYDLDENNLSKGISSERLQGIEIKEAVSKFTCQGKTYCSEMVSCEEAKFYLKNCPNQNTDGDGDGEPCESQWCN